MRPTSFRESASTRSTSRSPVVGATAATLAFHAQRLYATPAFRRPLGALLRMAGAWTLLALCLMAALFVLRAEDSISRMWLAMWSALSVVLLLAGRLGLARFVEALAHAGRLQRRAVVVGGGDLGAEVLRGLKTADPAELRILGVFDDRGDARSPDFVEGFQKLGTVDDLVAFARRSRVDVVIFALPITAEQRILTMLRKLCVLPVDIRLAAHANHLRFRPRSYSYIGPLPVLDILDTPIADWNVVIKYVFDKVVGSLALIALSPVLILTALAIRLETPGPVLFKQKRYGFNNELIEVYKFRSMYADRLDAAASKLVTRDDPRVTRVGRFIRKTSIDELPQLFNVVLSWIKTGCSRRRLYFKASSGMVPDWQSAFAHSYVQCMRRSGDRLAASAILSNEKEAGRDSRSAE